MVAQVQPAPQCLAEQDQQEVGQQRQCGLHARLISRTPREACRHG